MGNECSNFGPTGACLGKAKVHVYHLLHPFTVLVLF